MLEALSFLFLLIGAQGQQKSGSLFANKESFDLFAYLELERRRNECLPVIFWQSDIVAAWFFLGHSADKYLTGGVLRMFGFLCQFVSSRSSLVPALLCHALANFMLNGVICNLV